MQFEVERKFWIDDWEDATAVLAAMNVEMGPVVTQTDRYFSHPARDFGATDEALRLREMGTTHYITYKGARIDSTTKTRRELELPLPSGVETSSQFTELLGLLGFEPVMTIRKLRRKAELEWDGFKVEVCLDEIDQLGQFIELEITSDLEHLDATKAALASLATRLQLSRSERRSYLELLMSQLGPGLSAG